MDIGFLDHCRYDGWDGPGSLGVPERSVRRARDLLRFFPGGGHLAAVAAGGDGSVGIEYPLPHGEFWLDIERDDKVRTLVIAPGCREERVFGADDPSLEDHLASVLGTAPVRTLPGSDPAASDRLGSIFDSFLAEQGLLDEVHREAARRVAAWQAGQAGVRQEAGFSPEPAPRKGAAPDAGR